MMAHLTWISLDLDCTADHGSLDFDGTSNGNTEGLPDLDDTEDGIPGLNSGYCCCYSP